MSPSLGPLTLVPRLVPKPWGGRRLADLGRDLPPGTLVGESWDVADLPAAGTSVPDPVTRVAHGPHAGRTLQDLIREHGSELLGGRAPSDEGRFPLLLKHLDAEEDLSVQVHPPESVLDQLPGARLKTESWVVVAARPGAELLLGVVPGTSPEDVERALGTPALLPLLRRVPARVGDVHHVPAGMVHALGAGVVVAEPQTPSDTTYRLYDWFSEHQRAPRPLHPDEAMRCLRAAWEVNIDAPRSTRGDGTLVSTPHYSVARHSSVGGGPVLVPARTSARVVVVITGRLVLTELFEPLTAGGVVLLPATWEGRAHAAAGTTWLDVDL